MKSNTKLSMLVASVVAVASVLMITVLPASAHVTVDPSDASKGGYGVFTLRVPNEDPTQATVKLEVQIPQDHPIASVRVEPKPGWTYSVEKTKLADPIKDDDGSITEAVSKITFEGGQIKPGEFDEFKISMGPLPKDTDKVTLKAIQTYADGKEVKWIEESTGGDEPEHPAPVIMLGAEQDDHHASTSSSDSEMTSDDNSTDTVAYIALGTGVLALIAAGVAIAKKK